MNFQQNTGFDPIIISTILGVVWPFVQSFFDRTKWSATWRRVLPIVAAIILSVFVWFFSAYPLQWERLIAQAGVILGVGQTVFTILKKAGIIDGVATISPLSDYSQGGENDREDAGK